MHDFGWIGRFVVLLGVGLGLLVVRFGVGLGLGAFVLCDPPPRCGGRVALPWLLPPLDEPPEGLLVGFGPKEL